MRHEKTVKSVVIDFFNKGLSEKQIISRIKHMKYDIDDRNKVYIKQLLSKLNNGRKV